MFTFLLDDTFLYLAFEIYLFVYILGIITYSVCFNGLSSFAYPALLNSNLSFTLFSLSVVGLLFSTSDLNLIDLSNVTSFGIIFKTILLTSVVLINQISKKTLNGIGIFKYEYDAILLFSVLGLLLLNSCNDLLMFYLGVELQSLSFYVLATFNRNSEYNAEAGIKYFILGALSSGFLLFGFSLIYISFGTVVFEDIIKLNISGDFMTSWSLLFIIIALLFKIGAFPFHQWLCDVYEGVLITITAFYSAVPKAILFALLTRLIFTFVTSFVDGVESLIIFSGLSSIIMASIAALYQKRLKRLLAYSAISHSGFILLAIGCNSVDSIKASVIYILIYLVMTTALFSVIFIVLRSTELPKFLINWSYFATQNQNLGLTFSCLIFSMAGIPPLAGFYSKLGVFSCLLFNDFVLTSAVVAIFSSIACFYYIRLIRVFFFVENSKSTLWSGFNSSVTNFILSWCIIFTVFCLCKPTFLSILSTLISVSLI